MSLPTRECGLKSLSVPSKLFSFVTPYAGVWIEMPGHAVCDAALFVTPYAGVWIEICRYLLFASISIVTPYAGVWIEIGR